MIDRKVVVNRQLNTMRIDNLPASTRQGLQNSFPLRALKLIPSLTQFLHVHRRKLLPHE